MKEYLFRERIKSIMPDLIIDQLVINEEGLANDVVIVNKALVFRFVKDDNSAKVLRKETNILTVIQPKVDVKIPHPFYDDFRCVVYPFIAGKPFHREVIVNENAKTQSNLATELGTFLAQLHSIEQKEFLGPKPTTLASVSREQWLEKRAKIEQKIYPLLLPHQISWAERLFDTYLSDEKVFDYQPALIHGDLAPYHILLNRDKKRIAGIIDFGVAGFGDPALDIGNLITCYGESFVAKMEPVYPEFYRNLPRARFYAQAIELDWVLLGLESGEKFWFTAHIGGARDIQSYGNPTQVTGAPASAGG